MSLWAQIWQYDVPFFANNTWMLNVGNIFSIFPHAKLFKNIYSDFRVVQIKSLKTVSGILQSLGYMHLKVHCCDMKEK